jgi:fumarate hydratase, class II
MRLEHDSMGIIEVQSDRQWGAQTARAQQHFAIGSEKMPLKIIYALALYKQASARANYQLGKLSEASCQAIEGAIEEILAQKWDSEFPLSIFQSGSGTQTHMNLNEVIARRASAMSGLSIHPNDQVNASQSTNDAFSCAMHMAVVIEFEKNLKPVLTQFKKTLQAKQRVFSPLRKMGRTHLQDAVSLTLGQEFSGYVAAIYSHLKWLRLLCQKLLAIPAGGTAVGTGLNAPRGFMSG